ncbi:MAG: STN domain-containing protein, partial [Verrucomicrobiota bacterium]
MPAASVSSEVRCRFAFHHRNLLVIIGMFFCACGFAALPPASTAAARIRFAIPAGPAADTLRQFSAQCGPDDRLLYAAAAVEGTTTRAVQGEFTPREALEAMLAGSGLVAVVDAETKAFVVTRAPEPAGATHSPATNTNPPA